jgi:16S rRNA C1402 (ribose-2'-O) methylase RsmI
MNAATEILLATIGLATAVMAFLAQRTAAKAAREATAAAAAALIAAAATEKNHTALQQIQVTVDGNLTAVRRELASAHEALLALRGEASEAIGVKLEKERQEDEPHN